VLTYCWTHVLLGAGVLCWTLVNWQSPDYTRFVSYLLSAVIAALFKVRLPGVTGAVSVSFLFLLIGIIDLGPQEAIVMGALSMLAQCVWRTAHPPRFRQVAFNIASVITAIYLSALVFTPARNHVPEPLALGLVALSYYFTNTFPVASIIALTEAVSPWKVFLRNRWLLPYYVGATSVAWLIGTMPRAIQWEVPIICLPVVYVVHRSYRTYLGQMEQEKKHVEDLNALHMRTIETLALAIDAKDHTTHNHVQRVQIYAVEIGKELGLEPDQLDALRAASVLHDIGKLAVPEHIISKPGKLTPAEFQKMKVHPIVGAEILERVLFPYPVVPIVRSHHEKWDGSGYPDGLAGEQIPIGARILAAVDCFDALSSDRQYRRALPLDEAIAKVVSESGTSFDPAVVEVLQRRYRELETMAQALSSAAEPVLSTDICVTRGAAPAAGFAVEAPASREAESEQSLEALGLEEALAVAAVRIKRLMAFDAMACFVRDGEVLRSAFVAGAHSAGLWGLNIPVGTGLAGWVADTGQPIVNGNPSVEPGYVSTTPLQSALAIPVVDGCGRAVAVVAVYRSERDGFSAQQVNSLLALSRPLAQMMDSKDLGSRSIERLANHLLVAEAVQ